MSPHICPLPNYIFHSFVQGETKIQITSEEQR